MTDPPGPQRVAVISDGAGVAHGVPRTLAQLRTRGVPGYELELVVLETVAERSYDLIHVHTPGRVAGAAVQAARAIGIPAVGTYHAAQAAPHFYQECSVVLAPTAAADAALRGCGVAPERIFRWQPGVDSEQFNPGCYAPEVLPSGFTVLYAGALSEEHRIGLLADAFLLARDRDPRLRLALAGAGPGEDALRARLGDLAVFLGWLEEDALSQVYATADLLVFSSPNDTFMAAILEAQASGLPVLALADSSAAELIADGRSGCLVPADPEALAAAIVGLARRPAIRDRLATGGLLAIRERSWERSLHELAAGYRAAVSPPVAEVPRAA